MAAVTENRRIRLPLWGTQGGMYRGIPLGLPGAHLRLSDNAESSLPSRQRTMGTNSGREHGLEGAFSTQLSLASLPIAWLAGVSHLPPLRLPPRAPGLHVDEVPL